MTGFWRQRGQPYHSFVIFHFYRATDVPGVAERRALCGQPRPAFSSGMVNPEGWQRCARCEALRTAETASPSASGVDQ